MATTSSSSYPTYRVYLYVADPDTTLLTHDQVVVQEQDASGNWVDLTDPDATISIVSGKCNYFYVAQDNIEEGDLFRPVLRDSNLVNADVPQTERPALDDTYRAIITAEEVKNIYLFGLDLTDDNGNEFPDELLRHYILTAISQTSLELDLSLLPTKFIERYDYWAREYEDFLFIQLVNKPLVSVDKVALEYPIGTEVIEYPSEWLRVKHHAGQIEVVPATGTYTQLLVNAGGNFLPTIFQGADYIPDLIRVEYVAGFLPTTDGFLRQGISEAQYLPSAIKEVIGKKAAFGPLNTAGDLIVGAGIANRSISIDGLSETIGTTSSATNAGYGARLIQYEKELKKAMPVLRKFFQGARLAVA
jgi:hypothetical protein